MILTRILTAKAEFLTMSQLIRIVCFSALVFSSVKSARILAVFPTPSVSHQVVFGALTQELARRGHEVVVITTDPVFPKGQAPTNLTEINVHDISYEVWNKLLATNANGNVKNIAEQLDMYIEVILKIFEKQTEVPDVRDIIKNQNNFDLLLLEAWPRFFLGFSHVVKAPVIAISSFGVPFDNYNVIGAPSHPFLYPVAITGATRIYNLTLWEKITHYYIHYQTVNLFQKAETRENVVVRRVFGEDTPDLSQLQNNIGMLFLNIHPLWEGNRPVPPSVIHVGGMHQKPERELPQDLKQYLDSSTHGVIYISFGTNVDTSALPADKIQAIINVFSQLPYDVLWKWNQDELPGRTKNIRISKWFPQSDLLRHPKVKLFITQGGLQSTDETITAGVPVIGIPMIGDQWYNAEKYEYHKIGKKILLDDLNEKTLRDAIKTVIEDKSYRENVVRLRTLMRDQPLSSLERAVWWTEHVLRQGAAHLRAPAANMPAAQYYELQLVLTVLGVAGVVLLLVSLIVYKLIRFVLRWSSVKVKIS